MRADSSFMVPDVVVEPSSMEPTPHSSSIKDHETAPCLACGQETEIPEEVHSPVCYRPLCNDCDDDQIE